jgi:hypothetical protein
MTHPTRNPNAQEPTSKDVRRVSSFVVLVLMLLFAAPLTASDRDFELESKVHRALSANDPLKKLNLFVRVIDGKASLSGAVPSAELRQQALRIAEKVDGVLAVRGDGLYVASSGPKAKPMIVVPLEDRPTQTRSASPGSPPSDSRTPFSPTPSPRPADTGEQITLLAPEAALRPARAPEPARLTVNPRSAPPVVALTPAVEGLRRNNPRFQQIRTQVRNATVYIYPGNTSGEDVMLFAQAVRRLSGVQHVIVASGSP